MFVLKTCNYPKLSEANFHARLCHLKQLLKKYYQMMLATLLFTCEKIFAVITPKNWQNDRMYAHQEERRRDKALAHIINVQSLTASVGE